MTDEQLESALRQMYGAEDFERAVEQLGGPAEYSAVISAINSAYDEGVDDALAGVIQRYLQQQPQVGAA
jgi:hypothetical protein